MDTQNDIYKIVNVDLICVIIVSIFALYAMGDFVGQFINLHFSHWIVLNIYQSFSLMGVPLLLMLSGALLLAPSKKDEDITIFLKKCFTRLSFPLVFWTIVYFIWAFYIENNPFTLSFIISSILEGPYFVLWYLYMLVGLYLVTPMLRVMVAHFTDRLFKCFLCLWFIGATIPSLIVLFSNGQYHLSVNVFIMPFYVGYFVAGVYLVNVNVRRWVLGVLTFLGFILTVITAIVMAIFCAENSDVSFYQWYFSPFVILASFSFFMLLNSYAKPKVVVQTQKPSWKQRLIHTISKVLQRFMGI
ncbi:MAG: acyltransferase family protein [Candidatus Bathyarchaeota archaeon]|nr:acyltransferase family protein [Candidatus Termiticorpusculum sp.]MCL2869131.1 acyltransferase family protein [Candidatus Termiticorpusculum sp.]